MTVKMTETVTVIMTVISAETSPRSGLRQAWFLAALRAGRHVSATELAERWSISETTARRDVSILKANGLIEFVGSRRSGK
jgi:DNA-binding GntR family transcriptional regulator